MQNKLFTFINSKILKISLFFLAIIYSFNLIFWGLHFTDVFYFINLFPDYSSHPMISGTLAIGYLGTKLFGNNLIIIRILSWIIQTLAILLPYFLLIEKRKWIDHLHYLSFSIILLGILFFGPDVLTWLLFSISLISIIKYYQTHNLYFIILLGILSSYSVLVRFPNILLFPIILCSIPFIESYHFPYKEKSFIPNLIKSIVLFVFTYIVTFLLCIYLLHENLINYFSIFQSNTNSIDDVHSFKHLITITINSYNYVFLYLGILFVAQYIFELYKKVNSRIFKSIFLFIGYIFFIHVFYYEINLSSYNWKLATFIYALILFFILQNIKKNIIEHKENINIIFFLIILFSLISTIGSNAIRVKFQYFLLCFFPIILIQLNINIKKIGYLIPVIFLFISFTILTYFINPFEDANTNNLTSSIRTEKQLKFIKTTNERASFITDVMSEYSQIKGKDNVVFFGRGGHLFYYLTGVKPLYRYTFWMLSDDKYEINNIKKLITNSHPTLFFIYSYPELLSKKKYNEVSEIETILIKANYKVKLKKYYKIYYFDN